MMKKYILRLKIRPYNAYIIYFAILADDELPIFKHSFFLYIYTYPYNFPIVEYNVKH